MSLTTLLLLIGAGIGLVWSFIKDRGKTIESIRVAKSRFVGTAVEIVGVLALVGLFFAFVPPNSIKELLGGANVFLSGLYGSLIGTVTIIPAFVAFPLSASLVEKGAHLVAVAAFITTLTMVGFATAPIEMDHFGKRFTLVRNGLSFAFALVIAMGMMIFL